MDYNDIIKENCKSHSAVSWWPRFAFHYTDLTNAVSILSSGRLYSRTRAEALGLMHNDNASRQVIDMTQTEATASVRFYFRPLTPTQYYNEGFKHPDLRYAQDPNANVPVPIFLLFDLEKLLTMRDVKFSEHPQSGYGSHLCSGVDEYKKFHFDHIYSKGYVENFDQVKKYRHAEILYPGSFEINTCLQAILCRNYVEQTTLLNLLKETDSKAFHKYKPMIKICRDNVFENNALFIKDCRYHDGTVSVTFCDSYNKNSYITHAMKRYSVTTLQSVTGRLELTWRNARGVCDQTAIESNIDYRKPSPIVLKNMPVIQSAKSIQIRFFLEDKMMCFMEQPLSEAELIK